MTYALLINNHFVNEYNTIDEATEKAKELYSRTIWQEKPDHIEVRDIFVDGDYKDVGKRVFYSESSSRFWKWRKN